MTATFDNTFSGWLQDSLLCRQWGKICDDVDLHKWYESERAGHDIGWDRAYASWLVHIAPYGDDWRMKN